MRYHLAGDVVSFDVSQIEPYLPLISSVAQTALKAIEDAVAAHQGGDPAAALGILNQALADLSGDVGSMRDALAAADKRVDAAEDAKFPATQPLSATVKAVHDQIMMRLAPLPVAP